MDLPVPGGRVDQRNRLVEQRALDGLGHLHLAGAQLIPVQRVRNRPVRAKEVRQIGRRQRTDGRHIDNRSIVEAIG